MCSEQTPEQIAADMEEGFRQIEADQHKAADAALEMHFDDTRGDDEEDEYPDEITEVNVGGGPGGWMIYE